MTSSPPANSVPPSKRPFTLAKPAARRGTPSSRNRKEPAPAPPVNTGERMAVRLSWPDPRWILTPATAFNISDAWMAATFSSSFWTTIAIEAGSSMGFTY